VAAFLLDANMLIALAWPDHEFHEKVGRWFARHSRNGWATCPFTQSAFVRILSNPAFSANALTPENAVSVLESNLNSPTHHFWPDSISVPEALKNSVKGRLTGHRQTTDAYLLGLAIHHRSKLATIDRGIREWGIKEAVEVIE
jgi:toxin-antitoxin system PIN domain toxin